jgi:hypothetical protein
MKRVALVVLLLLCGAMVVRAQTTAVTGTIKDVNGVAWAGATVNFLIPGVPPPGTRTP